MIRKIVQFVICIGLAPLLAAQEVCQAENQVSRATPAETLFAYRSSMNRRDSSDSISLLSAVPFGRAVELTPVDPAAWANATVGSTLTFRVINEVDVRGRVFNRSSYYAYAYAGTLIQAKVIRVREGKLRTQHGIAEPRVKEVMMGKSTKLELESSPGGRARFSGIAKNLVVKPLEGVRTVGEDALLFPLLMIACSTGCDL
ncbi:MAG: hypothetical protein ABSF16_16270 [Terracidiphilus sp.]|jgi:hypothetical protein